VNNTNENGLYTLLQTVHCTALFVHYFSKTQSSLSRGGFSDWKNSVVLPSHEAVMITAMYY